MASVSGDVFAGSLRRLQDRARDQAAPKSAAVIEGFRLPSPAVDADLCRPVGSFSEPQALWSLGSSQVQRVEGGVRPRLDQAAADHESAMTVVRTAASSQLREAAQALDFGYIRLTDGVDNSLCWVALDPKRLMELIAHRSERQLDSQIAIRN